MIPVRIFLTLILSAGLTGVSSGQVKNLSFSLSGNYTFIGKKTYDANLQPVPVIPATGYVITQVNIASIEESYEGRPGFDFDIRAQVFHFKRFFIEAGLGVNYFRYKRNMSVTALSASSTQLPVTIGGLPYGSIISTPWMTRDSTGRLIIGGERIGLPEPDDKIGETTVLYLQIPLIVGRNFRNDRFQVRSGITLTGLLRATEYKPAFSQFPQPYFYTYKETSGDGFNKMLVNVSLELTYRVTKQIGVSTGMLHSISGIYVEDNRPGGRAVYSIVDFGVRYQLRP